MDHERWSIVVGYLAMTVCSACALIALGIAVWSAWGASRDVRAARDRIQEDI